MTECSERSSNAKPRPQVASVSIALGQEKMAELEGSPSNSVFEELADWEHQLKHIKSELEGPGL